MDVVLVVLRLLALLALGTYAGGLLFTSPLLVPGLSRLPGPAYTSWWQSMNTDLGRRMPPFLLGSLAVLVAVTLLSTGDVVLLAGAGAATGLLLAGIVLTVAVMEPLNRVGDGWEPATPPDDLDRVRDRWTRLQVVRTGLGVASFASLASTLVVAGSVAGV